jgi:hypothetical protein
MIQTVVNDVRREIISQDESDDSVEYKLTGATQWPDACTQTRFYDVAVQSLRERVSIPQTENGKEVGGDSIFRDFCDKYREDGLKLLVYDAWRIALKQEKDEEEATASPQGKARQPSKSKSSREIHPSSNFQEQSTKQRVMAIDYVLSSNQSG